MDGTKKDLTFTTSIVTVPDSKETSSGFICYDFIYFLLMFSLCSVGSGSTFAYGILDTAYKWDMTDDEARELGRRAIHHATHRFVISFFLSFSLFLFYA